MPCDARAQKELSYMFLLCSILSDEPQTRFAGHRARSAASLEADLTPKPQAENALVAVEPEPKFEPGGELEPAPGTHPVDMSAYKWVPVLRRPRSDGWTPQRQVDFIAALADLGCVEHAAKAAGMSAKSCYRLRRAPGAENFAAAWDVALQHAARVLLDLAFDRAIHGTDEPVFDKDGRRTGRRMRQNDRLMMFLLRAYMPERFRHAHRDGREPDEALPPPAPPIGPMLRLLEPPAPPEPHTLLEPGELEDALTIADVGPGELPHWHRGKGDAEPIAQPPEDPEFERALEAAKRQAWGLPPEADRAKGDWDEWDGEEDDWEDGRRDASLG